MGSWGAGLGFSGCGREAESFGSDPVKYVALPWDVPEAYYFRAARTAQSLPEEFRAAWIEKVDIAERAGWMSEFHEGNLTLGRVVQSVCTKRESHWEAPPTIQVAQPNFPLLPILDAPSAGQQQHQPQQQKRTKTKGKGKGKAKPSTGTVATHLKDGKKVCADFQRSKCYNKMCTKGIHNCGKVNKQGKVCGGWHSANKCRTK